LYFARRRQLRRDCPKSPPVPTLCFPRAVPGDGKDGWAHLHNYSSFGDFFIMITLETTPPATLNSQINMTAEAHRARAAFYRSRGDESNARQFEAYAKHAESRATQKRIEAYQNELGSNYLLTCLTAQFLAHSLSAKRSARGAKRWIAQQALEVWLPAMPESERVEVLAALRRCSERQLGKPLAKLVATFNAR
jgi:hypothetical protein